MEALRRPLLQHFQRGSQWQGQSSEVEVRNLGIGLGFLVREQEILEKPGPFSKPLSPIWKVGIVTLINPGNQRHKRHIECERAW